MKKINRAVILAALSTALVIGSSVNGASAQASESDGDFNFTVVAKDLAYGEASFSIEERQRLTVNGATQLTWWAPNHNVKVTNASLKKAPRIKVIYKACSVQSKSIAKQAKGASIVIAKPGSVICNTGKNGNIVGGFKWTVTKGPAVLKWNKSLKLYEHVFNLIKPSELQPGDEVVGHVTIGGVRYAIVKVCKNRMGGHVDVMYPSVVQVRYEQDVKESGKAVAKAAVGGTVTFSITCPNGANFNTTVTTSAEANASASILFTERTRVSALDAKKVELRHDLKVDGDADALAKAETKIEVSGSCGSQEVTYQAPTASGAAKACVNVGEQNGIITASGHNPNNVAAPGTLTVGGQTKQFASVGAGSSVTWDFSGFAPGTYNGSFSLGAPINKSGSFTVTVNACVRQPGSIVEVTDINDVRYGSTRTWRIRGMVPEGQSAVLKVSARIGTVKESDKSITLASGAFDLTITYTAPTEGSTDTLTAMLFGSNGVKDDEKSDTFNLLPNPVDP